MRTVSKSIFTFENLWRAYIACRRRKRGTLNAQQFESRLLDNLQFLLDGLQNRTYRPSSAICFVQKKPKLREVFADDFSDRVVQHLLVNHLEPLYEPLFIHDSYACRRGKGTHAAVQRLRCFQRRTVQRGGGRAWYLKEDVAGFFMNIDKTVLFNLLQRRVVDQEALWLTKVIIDRDCTQNCRFKGNAKLLQRIPPHKTLFKVPPGKGLPIGNLTSQFFANVYLNELDQFVKRDLRCKEYIRYCDDFVLLAETPEILRQQRKAIAAYLGRILLLRLNPGQHRLQPVSNGIDFLGYVTRPSHVLVRRRVVHNCREKLDAFTQSLAVRNKQNGPVQGWRNPEAAMEHVRAVAASYLGHFAWANSQQLTVAIYRQFPVLRVHFLLANGKLSPRLQPPKHVRGVRRSWRWFVPNGRHVNAVSSPMSEFPLWSAEGRGHPVLILMRVGKFYELYGEQAKIAAAALQLRLTPGSRGFRLGCGFPRRMLLRFLPRLLQTGRHAALVHGVYDAAGVKRWRVVALYRAGFAFCNRPAGEMVASCAPGGASTPHHLTSPGERT